jgi:folate-dependent tRNA-U54 methylase TrmFO/GidA
VKPFAGGALAMDRDLFAKAVTEALESHPNIRIVREEITALPGPEPMIWRVFVMIMSCNSSLDTC